MKKNGILILMLITVIALSGCKTPENITYFKDTDSISAILTRDVEPLKFKVGDKLNILVKAQGEDALSRVFGILPGEMNYSQSNVDSRNPQVYTVDSNGNVDFPTIGLIHVAGMTRVQLAETLKKKIIEEGYAKDVAVNVSTLDMNFSVMGEVAHPGRFEIIKDHLTILDALADAGDLTIYGKRENIKILRQENDHRKVYTINLTDAGNIVSSPAYYIQQDDVIYVEPNKAKAQNSEIGSMTTLWISLTSIGVSLVSLMFNILK